MQPVLRLPSVFRVFAESACWQKAGKPVNLTANPPKCRLWWIFLSCTAIIDTFYSKNYPIMKKELNAKEPVRIRSKRLADGSLSLYLDIYVGGKRRYEFLRLYLVPARDRTAKMQNDETLKLARAVKAQRIIEIQNHAYGFRVRRKSKITLASFVREAAAGNARHPAKQALLRALAHHIERHDPRGVPLQRVDKDYVAGFLAYLEGARQQHCKQEKLLRASTRWLYRKLLASCLDAAVAEGYIDGNPMAGIRADGKPAKERGRRVYLTLDEVARLARTDFHNTLLKKAFLFSCFCGLRHSDVAALTWGNLRTTADGGLLVDTVQRKTGTRIRLPLCREAVKQLPDRGGAPDGGKVFDGLITLGRSNEILHRWARQAGIGKHITFHTARHTHATMLLALGADIYTVSKLLGHASLRTTQVYAQVVDESKRKAVALIPEVT